MGQKQDETATEEDKQHSIITIVSMWSIMVGTSTLTMPWAIHQAGFALGLVLLMAMAALMAYTSCIVITSGRHITDTVITEFRDVVRFYLGKYAEIFALFSSALTLLGVSIIYWMLISNFLHRIVVFAYNKIHDDNPGQSSVTDDGVFCQNNTNASAVDLPDSLNTVWHQNNTVPLYLIVLILPLATLKSPTFFSKFSTLGALSILYLGVFVSIKAGIWGFHLNFEDSSSLAFAKNFDTSFPALTGTAAMAYFIQPALISITRTQRHPENNVRDLIIAYSLVFCTYAFIGVVFYSAFPLDKDCIHDNLLDNLVSTDILSLVARLMLFVQMTCALPLIMYSLRTQLLQWMFGEMWPGLKHVVLHNVVVVSICVLFAVFLPKIGRIISFVGAFCGLSYAIFLPCMVYMVSSHRRGTLTKLKLVFHCTLIILGVANLAGQFIIIG